MKNQKLKMWYMSAEVAVAAADAHGDADVVALPGHHRMEDFYVVVPRGTILKRLIPQIESIQKYGVWDAYYYVRDGSMCVARKARLIRYEASELPWNDEAREYVEGHRTTKEFFKKKVNPYMERARASHVLCDEPGHRGHDTRQAIRRALARGDVI